VGTVRIAASVGGAARIVLGVVLVSPLGGCALVGLTERTSTGTPVVRVEVSDSDLRLDPSTVHAGDVSFELIFSRDDSQHAPEGLFFVSRDGDPSAPAALSGDDVARLEDGTDQGLALDGGWGTATMRMRLSEGRYAFILGPPDGGPSRAPVAVAVLEVLP
jgi:hypothetical protein